MVLLLLGANAMAAISETERCFKRAMRPAASSLPGAALLAVLVCCTLGSSSARAQAGPAPDNVLPGDAHQDTKLPLLRIPPPRDVPWTELLDPNRALDGSLSRGMTSNGSLEGAAQLDLSGDAHHVLEPHLDRDTHWGTHELVNLLLESAAIARSRFPDLRMGVGNMSRREGGRIQWSRSHRCGRDVDLAFRYLDETGAPVDSPDLLVVDRRLRVRSREGWTLDVPRTWTMVAALIEAAPSHIQWLFVSRPIRTALLDHAAAIGAPDDIVRIASSVLHQPGDSAPHDDHLHVRIYCAQDDLLEGCDNWGPRWPHRPDYTDATTMRLNSLRYAWDQGGPETRRAVTAMLGTLYLGDGAIGAVGDLSAADDEWIAAFIPWLATHHPAAAVRASTGVFLNRDPRSPAWLAARDVAFQNRADALALAAVNRLSNAVTPDGSTQDPELANALFDILNELAPLPAIPALWALAQQLPDGEIRQAIHRVLARATAGSDVATLDQAQMLNLLNSIMLDPLVFRVAQLSDAGFSIVPSRRSTWRDLLDGLEDRRDWVRFTTREVLAALTGRPRPAQDATAAEALRYWRRLLQN
jgi:penicillin-insensitive murein endopeptidase